MIDFCPIIVRNESKNETENEKLELKPFDSKSVAIGSNAIWRPQLSGKEQFFVLFLSTVHKLNILPAIPNWLDHAAGAGVRLSLHFDIAFYEVLFEFAKFRFHRFE